MLRTIKSLEGHRLLATDGEFGKIRDFYFDDEKWGVRYLVADTGNWLTGRLVLIPPQSLGQPEGSEKLLRVSLSKQQIAESPSIHTDKPVSRQYEHEFHGYYNLAPYWAGANPPPLELAKGGRTDSKGGTATVQDDTDMHLRSCREVGGYHIQATDHPIGHVEDFIVDTDDKWKIRYMVVDTRNWLPGRKVLVSPSWIRSVKWVEHAVNVDLTREAVKGSPEFDPKAPINREYEAQLYDYYGRPMYW